MNKEKSTIEEISVVPKEGHMEFALTQGVPSC